MPSSTGSFASSSNRVPKLQLGTSFVPHFEANESIFRRSGTSYIARFDSYNPPDFTNVPIDGGLALLFGGTGFEIDGGSDLYVGNIVDPEREAVALPLPGCTLTHFYVASSVAPTSGQTFVLTVYKGSVATSMTATISGSGVSSSYTGNVSFSAGEKFSVRVTSSAGAATAFLTYSVRVE